MKEVTAVIVNFQTPELLENAVRSFKKFYPDINTLLFDNGSTDNSRERIKSLVELYPETIKTHFEKENIFHGPALHKVLTEIVQSKYCFFLDSDTVTKTGGFLEQGIEQLSADNKNYALGYMIKTNKRGFKDAHGIPVIVTPYLLLKTNLYKKFPPFVHHGQPVLNNFKVAEEKGYKLIHFPMDEYIDHLWRGTASKYGYKLGLKGKLDYLLNQLGL